MKRYRVIARDVDGYETGEIGRRRTLRGAIRLQRSWAATVPEPIPGRPLYTVHVERVA